MDLVDIADVEIPNADKQDGRVLTWESSSSRYKLKAQRTPSQVAQIVLDNVEDWSETGNTDQIPASKLTNVPSFAQVSASVNNGVEDWAKPGNTDALPTSKIPNLSASKITSGSFSTARIPNLSASKITSGVLGTGRLGSGTANNTKVLYGDGTWKDAPGGGSSYTRVQTSNSLTASGRNTPVAQSTGITIDPTKMWILISEGITDDDVISEEWCWVLTASWNALLQSNAGQNRGRRNSILVNTFNDIIIYKGSGNALLAGFNSSSGSPLTLKVMQV